MPSQYYFPAYNATINFNKFDVIYDTDGVYYYSTRDNNLGSTPLQVLGFLATSWTRSEDIVTVNFLASTTPYYTAGSIVHIQGLTGLQPPNYSGMVLGGGNGFVTYISPGYSQANVLAAAGSTVVSVNSPNWTTGFFFIPTYNTKISTENKPIIAQFGDMYNQRQPGGINTFNQTFSHVFTDRSKQEMRAITNFVQDKAGSYSFEILIPDESITNQPNQKFVAPSLDVTPVSFGLYDISVNLSRVFDL